MKIIIIIILLINYSCNSQNIKKTDITGNWFNYSMKNAKDIYYVETFIGDKAFHFYDDSFGLKSSQGYVIEGDILFFVDHDNTKTKSGNVKIIDENTISLYSGNVILKRIEKGLKLEDLLRKNKNESDYLKFFNKRRAVWEKSHNKE